jgi:hypothetical protein
MAVSVDTVYQRVLALANKEQRGYVTPIEFNLLANQAQTHIFEQYFYDLNKLERDSTNSFEYADPIEIVKEKISVFEVRDAVVLNGTTLPADLYRLGMVMYNGVEADYVSHREFRNMTRVKLLRPTDNRPIYTRDNVDLQVWGADANGATERKTGQGITCNYIKKPAEVIWNYVILPGAQGEYPLYNANTSANFELHYSEEIHLVNKILELAGIVINKPGLAQLAEQEQLQNINSQLS